MRLSAGIAALGVACALGGCATSTRDQVKAKVEQLAHAAGKHDYRTICDQVLAPSLITNLANAGISCPQAMQIAFGGVVEPSVSIGKITVSGAQAQAITLTTAKNQQPALAAIDLVKTTGGWRVSSLGSTLLPGGK